MAEMYSTQVLCSSKVTVHKQVSCSLTFVTLSQQQKQTHTSKIACLRLAEFIFTSVESQCLELSSKNNCDNLFLEGLHVLIVKELALYICLWMPAEVLWQDQILFLSSAPAGHHTELKQDLPHNWLFIAALWYFSGFVFSSLERSVTWKLSFFPPMPHRLISLTRSPVYTSFSSLLCGWCPLCCSPEVMEVIVSIQTHVIS